MEIFDIYDIVDRKMVHPSTGVLAVNVKWRSHFPDWVNDSDEHNEALYCLQNAFIVKAYELAQWFCYDGCDAIGRNGGWIAPYRYFNNSDRKAYIHVNEQEGTELGFVFEPAFRIFAEYANMVVRLFDQLKHGVKNSSSINDIAKLQKEIIRL